MISIRQLRLSQSQIRGRLSFRLVAFVRWTSFAILLLPVVLLSSGCSSIRVNPWERGNLAKAVMVRDGGGQHSALELHAYGSKESTLGGYHVGGGGCGCN